jgi:hypothetical protein
VSDRGGGICWFYGHPNWLRAVSASGLHQGAHVDITCTTTSGGWALVLPAIGTNRASIGGLALCLLIPCRGGPLCPPVAAKFALSNGHVQTRINHRDHGQAWKPAPKRLRSQF